MNRLVTKCATKKRVEENTNVSFLRHRQPPWTTFALLCSTLHTVIDWDRTWTLVSHAWLEFDFGCVHKLYPEKSDRIDYQPFVVLNL